LKGPWSYGSWIYNYLSPLVLWVRLPLWARCTTLCDEVYQWLAAGRWFSTVSSTNETDCHDIIEILLKVALNTKNQTNNEIRLLSDFCWRSMLSVSRYLCCLNNIACRNIWDYSPLLCHDHHVNIFSLPVPNRMWII